MKKVIIILAISIFLMGLAFAQGQGAQEGSPVPGEGIGAKIMAGNYVGEGGQQIQIEQQTQNKIQLKVNGISADCSLNLTQKQIQNKTRLETELSSGRNAEVKVMPDTASETALQRLRLKVCSVENNCNIELKEVGSGEQAKLAYELKTQRQSKFLGMFQIKMQVEAQVNAENGEIIRVKKPWWAFLASEPEE